MSYTISLTNGNTLTTLLDGTIDTSSTDLTLIGRNYTGFGQYYNENTVKLLENFASINPPTKPLIGQIWFNSATSGIEVYTTTGWRTASGPIVSDTEPSNLTTGDIWIDSRQDQLYFYDGTNLILAGPTWGKTQGITGLKSETIFDANGNPYTILVLYVSNIIYAIISNSAFTPSPIIPGFLTVRKGFQTSSSFDSMFYTTVTNSLQLDGLTSNQYMKLNQDQITTGEFVVNNDLGVTVGARGIGTFYVPPTTTKVSVKNNANGGILTLQTTDNSGNTNDVVYIDGANSRVGILNAFPTVALDVTGTTKTTNLSVTTSSTLAGLTITGTTVSSSTGITISPGTSQNITLTNTPRILGLAQPTSNNDAANKIYVDNTVKSAPLSLTFIDNGLESNINTSIILMLNDIADPTTYYPGKIAYIHVQHIDFVNKVVARYLKEFHIVGIAWAWVADLTSSI
jgi:hypothetical protein